jgi:hypothetical protein
MHFMLLVHARESDWGEMTEAEQKAVMEGHRRVWLGLQEAGCGIGGSSLDSAANAKLVRIRDGETLVDDGPFDATPEQLGGYYLIDVEDVDAAVAWAARIPTGAHGTIEVRRLT